MTIRHIFIFCFSLFFLQIQVSGQIVQQGAGSYSTTRLNKNNSAPIVSRNEMNVIKNFKGAIPTNTWVNGVTWYHSKDLATFQQPIYPLPLTMQFMVDPNQLIGGLRITNPSPHLQILKENFTSGHYQAVFSKDISRWDMSFMPTGYQEMSLARLDAWSAHFQLNKKNDPTKFIDVISAHGSPYVYFDFSKDVQAKPSIKFTAYSAEGQPTFFFGGPNQNTSYLGIKVNGKFYAVFAPAGVKWDFSRWATWNLSASLPTTKPYFVVATIPAKTLVQAEQALPILAKHAFAFIESSKITWQYDQQTSRVITTFHLKVNHVLGGDEAPILGLYPHQYDNNAISEVSILGLEFPDTIRGVLKLALPQQSSNNDYQFKTTNTFHGILPFMPPTTSLPVAKQQLEKYFQQYINKAENYFPAFSGANSNFDTYNAGKRLGQMTELLAIADQLGDKETEQALLAATKDMLQRYLNVEYNSTVTYFFYDKSFGTLIGYPSSHGSAKLLNDHHFHYGYFIYAAAQVALRDPNWAKQYGAMVNKLIEDIADNPSIDSQAGINFPMLRNFDGYEGHSWASGYGIGLYGPNQESSSEAMHAWAGIILWGAATHNKAIEDTGIYLYTTEEQAINHYWFDLQANVLNQNYVQAVNQSAPYATVILGGAYQLGTFFGVYPILEHGINMLPITAASLYLGKSPNYVKANSEAYNHYVDGKPTVVDWTTNEDWKQMYACWLWQNIMAEYYALYNPEQALKDFKYWTTVPGYQAEAGDSNAHSYAWIKALDEYGLPDFNITADTPLYAVFKKQSKTTYLAYNSSDQTVTVKFSDGTALTVKPKQLAYVSK